MQHGTLTLALVLVAGCGGGDKKDHRIDDPRPVDGPYRVAVTNEFGDDCWVKMIPADGPVYQIDVLLRGDGTLDLRTGSMVVGPGTLEGVPHDRGNIDHEGTYAFVYGDGPNDRIDYRYTVKGLLTPDMIDVTVTDAYENCEESSHIVGVPRPLTDPDALDGHYLLTATEYGALCPGDDAPQREGWRIAADVWDDGTVDRIGIVLDDQMVLWTDRPSADGALSWEGDWMWYTDWFPIEMTGRLAGTLSGPEVDLRMSADYLGYESDCPTVTDLIGAKRIPSVSEKDNDYRFHVQVHSTCVEDGEDQDWILERTGVVIMQDAALMEFTDFTGTYLLELEGDAFATTFGAPGSWTATIAGTIAPPALDYTVTYEEYASDGSVACDLTADVVGRVRYVFP